MGRPARAEFLGFALALALVAARSAHAEPAGSVRAEIGAEYDSNAARIEHVEGAVAEPEIESGLLRASLSADAAFAPSANQRVYASVLAGAKKFFDGEVEGEDTLVLGATPGWWLRAGQRFSLSLFAPYYDAFQSAALTGRDFRSLTAAGRVGATLGERGSAGLGGGYRWFWWRPDSRSDFRAPQAFVEFRQGFDSGEDTPEWEIALRGQFEARRFASAPSCPPATAMPPPDPGSCGDGVSVVRRDRFWGADLEIVRVSSFLVGAGYRIAGNQSNSYGETLLRHAGFARTSIGLPAGMFLAARAEVVAARFADPVVVGQDAAMQFLSVEDEAGSHARAELVIPVGGQLETVLRYALYSGQLGSNTTSYRRQTFFLGLAYGLGR